MNIDNLSEIQKYYVNGFLVREFLENKTLKSLRDLLVHLNSNNEIDSGFSWDSKYSNTFDLRHSAHEYSSLFMDILFENNIPELLVSLIGSEYTLSHIQVRKSKKGPSYMPWHRDAYFINGDLVGNIPPAHKIIFYPKILKEEPRLEIIKGSNLCMYQKSISDQFILPGCSQFDAEIMKIMDKKSYSSSDSQFLLFNTSALHNVLPDSDDNGSIRVIYSFVTKDQYAEKYSSKNIHKKLNEDYEKRLKA